MAATAGTSGVIYGVGDSLSYDKASRINNFAHVNHTDKQNRLGMLLCINGTGIMNSWTKRWVGNANDYATMNTLASQLPTGAENLQVLPFGNGAERIFNNKIIGAHLLNLDLNKHTAGHIYRAVQEGIAFAFKYGLDIMRENNIQPNIIRAGNANLFLSPLFLEAFVNTTQVPVELYETDGSIGAAKGGGIGAGIYKNAQEAFSNFSAIKKIEPSKALSDIYQLHYASWHQRLQNFI